MNVFISGGCKNGKSYKAQRIAKEQAEALQKPMYYVATMIPRDEEDHARIRRHLSEREGWGFITIEQGTDLTEILSDDSVDLSGVFLMDSVTALLDNEMFGGTGDMKLFAIEKVREDVLRFARETGNTVFVSDYIYGDCQQYGDGVKAYMKGLASVDRALAAVCDRVLEVSYSMVEEWK